MSQAGTPFRGGMLPSLLGSYTLTKHYKLYGGYMYQSACKSYTVGNIHCVRCVLLFTMQSMYKTYVL